MCQHLDDAIARAINNIHKIGESINNLKVPCRYKGAFLEMADYRGFRFTDTTLKEMETIGKTNSNILFHLLDGKKNGIGVPYILATYLDTDKKRALALGWLEENKKKRTEKNVLKAVLSVRVDD